MNTPRLELRSATKADEAAFIAVIEGLATPCGMPPTLRRPSRLAVTISATVLLPGGLDRRHGDFDDHAAALRRSGGLWGHW